MRIGSIVIANDLLGIVTDLKDDKAEVKDKKGVVRSIDKRSCVEIIGPYEISLLLLKKLMNEVNK